MEKAKETRDYIGVMQGMKEWKRKWKVVSYQGSHNRSHISWITQGCIGISGVPFKAVLGIYGAYTPNPKPHRFPSHGPRNLG